MSVERPRRARRLGRRACARRRVRRRARMPNPRSAGNERATVPRRRTPGNGRRETPRRVESGAESRVDRARTFVGILRPFAVCRAGARDEEGEESGALRALGHVSPRVVAKTSQCWLYVQTNYPYETFFPRQKARADSRWRSTRCALMRNEVLHALAARHASRPRRACSRFELDGASGGTRGVRRHRARAVRCRPRGRCLRGMGRRVPRVDVDAVARSEKVHAEGGGDAHSGACARPRFPGGGAGGPSRDTSAACFPSLAPRRLRDSPPRARSRWTPPRNIT